MAAHLHNLSFPKPPRIHFIASSPSPSPTRRSSLRLRPINSSGINEDGNSNGASPPPGSVEIRFRRRPRRRRLGGDEEEEGKQPTAVKDAPKKWEDMSVGEKVLELYVGEKGLLFWLNKFAYASIFIVIGCWILFRFVGPSLNLYQLDTQPLSPTSVFK